MESLWILCFSAFSVALLHALIGPDHYVPFVALARANRWGVGRAVAVTALCGLGHVLSSILLGFLGIGAGLALAGLERLESSRGLIASYLLIGAGIAYATWGLRQARRGRTHSHLHAHEDGTLHVHPHRHGDPHRHLHLPRGRTAWWLVVLFGLGPCEPLIPLLMYPAAVHGASGVALVSVVFGLTTIAAMAAAVAVLLAGIGSVRPLPHLERYAHFLAGATIALSGVMVKIFGI